MKIHKTNDIDEITHPGRSNSKEINLKDLWKPSVKSHYDKKKENNEEARHLFDNDYDDVDTKNQIYDL